MIGAGENLCGFFPLGGTDVDEFLGKPAGPFSFLFAIQSDLVFSDAFLRSVDEPVVFSSRSPIRVVFKETNPTFVDCPLGLHLTTHLVPQMRYGARRVGDRFLSFFFSVHAGTSSFG